MNSLERRAQEEKAGEVGSDLAKALTLKIRETLDAFPASTHVQKSAIAELIADGVEEYREEQDEA